MKKRCFLEGNYVDKETCLKSGFDYIKVMSTSNYTDTDSLVTNLKLPSDLCSIHEHGLFKLEHTIKDGLDIY